mmetsp:Transcript_9339/g.10199  ORF Transcript_9339/g.10199 Transcript_9339/m.10199 type:complete len:96 (-) Transcript_9339:268-555(-)
MASTSGWADTTPSRINRGINTLVDTSITGSAVVTATINVTHLHFAYIRTHDSIEESTNLFEGCIPISTLFLSSSSSLYLKPEQIAKKLKLSSKIK